LSGTLAPLDDHGSLVLVLGGLDKPQRAGKCLLFSIWSAVSTRKVQWGPNLDLWLSIVFVFHFVLPFCLWQKNIFLSLVIRPVFTDPIYNILLYTQTEWYRQQHVAILNFYDSCYVWCVLHALHLALVITDLIKPLHCRVLAMAAYC